MITKPRSLSFVFIACAIVASSPEARAGFNVNVIFNDAGGANKDYYDRINGAMQSAADAWGRYIKTEPVTLDIQFNFTNEATASAGSTGYFQSYIGGIATFELGSLTKLTTGRDPSGAAHDAVFNLGRTWMTSTIFWNPAPGSTTIPGGKVDSHYTFMHELGHILGFLSFRDADGKLGSSQTTFDANTRWIDGNLYYVGDTAMYAYGGKPVPLTFGNFSHVGNSQSSGRPGADLVEDVMNGVVSKSGFRYELSAVGVAMLADLGYTLTAEGHALIYGIQPVPEPASIIALAAGLAGLGMARVASNRRRAA